MQQLCIAFIFNNKSLHTKIFRRRYHVECSPIILLSSKYIILLSIYYHVNVKYRSFTHSLITTYELEIQNSGSSNDHNICAIYYYNYNNHNKNQSWPFHHRLARTTEAMSMIFCQQFRLMMQTPTKKGFSKVSILKMSTNKYLYISEKFKV